MPQIIGYEIVLKQLEAEGLKCHYYNGGSFGFPPEANAQIRGWIGPEDVTIKPAVLPMTRKVPEPYEQSLTDPCAQIWQHHLKGNVWLMPASHWSYELNFGSRDWMPQLLQEIGFDPGLLANRANAAAIEFSLHEIEAFTHVVRRLLEMLAGSDFLLAFPGRATVCTVHHHKQLWWVSIDAALINQLDSLVKIGP